MSRWIPPGSRDERGAALVLTAVVLVVMLGFAALVIDIGQIYFARSQLQTGADAAAVAAGYLLPDQAGVDAKAIEYANANDLGHGPTTSGSDVDTGHWDDSSRTFTEGGSPVNAVRVTTNRTAAYGNPVDNVLADALGIDTSDVTATAVAVKRSSLLDFEGIAAGAQPASISYGSGISGDPIEGVVGIQTRSKGLKNDKGQSPPPGGWGPMIYDSTCTGGATGGDPDLCVSGQGNILIISEDGQQDDPDDDGTCKKNANNPPASVSKPSDVTTVCSIVFDFRGLGEGTVTIDQVTLVDVEEDAYVWLYRDGALVGQVELTLAGDGQVALRPVIGAPEADIMVVVVNGSGAVDDIGYTKVVKLVG